MDKVSSSMPAVVAPAQGRRMRAFGEEVTVLLGGNETGGQFTLFCEVTPPGGGPPPHYHLDEDEWFYVLEGQASFLLDGQWQDVPVGTALFMPRGVVHTFRNVGPASLKMLVTTRPSGFEQFFGKCQEEFTRPGGPDYQRITEISAEHGIHFVQPVSGPAFPEG